ncbi:MAG: VCBS repeat-containing protein, partial [Gammaproteobacteria bacterium]|nr:VCBS repeat-containing protein [Gammaproteobacteria bacterium]
AALLLPALSAPLCAAPADFSFVEDFQTRDLVDTDRSPLWMARWTTGGVTLGHAQSQYRHATNFWTARARLGNSSDTVTLIDDIGLQDMNGDGRLDVITASNDTGISIYFIGAIGSLSSAHTVSTLAAIRPVTVTTKRSRDIAFGDFDRDGDMDILAADRRARVRMYRNDGNGVFTEFPVSRVFPVDVAAEDMDGDGDLDIVATGRGTTGNVYVYLNDGRGNFSLHRRLPVGTYTLNRALALGDLNGDGRPDIVLGKYRAASVFYLNDGSGGFGSAQTLRYAGDAALVRSVALGDVDNDGDLDILAGGRRRDTVLYLNNGAGGFADGRFVHRTGVFDLELADMDGDGDLDLVEGTKNNTNVYRNDGNGVFETTGSYLGMRSRTVAVGDVNGDGAPDVVMGDRFTLLEAISVQGWSGHPQDAAGGVSYDNSRSLLLSRKVNGDAPVPRVVRFTAAAEQPLYTRIYYYLTNNGGARWYQAYRGERVRFLTPGDDLRWRVQLRTKLPSLTPVLKRIAIEGVEVERHITLSQPAPVPEGGVVRFTVSIGAGETTSDGAVSVAWLIRPNGDAPAVPSDFREPGGPSMRVAPRGTAVIPNGAREVTVAVLTQDDLRVETTESYTIVLSNPVNAELATTSSRIGFIGMSDFDRLPLRPLKLSAAPATVDEGEDIRFTVAIDTHAISCSVCHLYGSGDFGVFIGESLKPPAGTVAVAWRISGSGDNPASPSDFAGLAGEPMAEFPSGVAVIPNDRREVTITVPTIDNDAGGDAKTYAVTLSDPGLSARLVGAASQGGVIRDNDTPPALHIPAPPAPVAEGATLIFTIVLGYDETPVDEAVRVAWNISSGADALSTVSPQDFADAEGNPMSDFPGGVAVITSGSASATVSIATFDDNANEATETYTVTLGNPAGAAIASTATGFVISASTRTGAISDRADETVVTITADRALEDQLVIPAGTTAIYDIALQDLNGDDRLDVVTAGENGIVVYFNGFPWASSAVVATAYSHYLTFGDYDKDGDVDIVAGSWEGQVHVMLYKNDGRGGFDSGAAIDSSLSILRVNDLETADMDGDGHLDLVLPLNGPSGGIDLYRGDGAAGFQWRGRVDSAYPSWDVSVGDINGDGRPDIVVGKKRNASVYHLNLGGWRFGGAVSLGHVGNSTALGDVNKDGHLDIVMVVQLNHNNPYLYNRLRLYLNNGQGGFGAGAEIGNIYPTGDVALGDMDGDGDLDIVTGTNRDYRSRGLSYIYANHGHGNFDEAGANLHIPYARTRVVALGDVDNNGDLDIAFGGRAGDALWIKMNPGVMDPRVLADRAAANHPVADEGDTAAFTVSLSGGVRTADVEVPFTVTGDRADYRITEPSGPSAAITTRTPTAATGLLTITTASAAARIVLSITDDLVFESEEPLGIILGAPRISAGGARLGAAASATVVISASDPAVLNLPATPPTAAEGAAITFTISLSGGVSASGGGIGATWRITPGGANPVRPQDFADARGRARGNYPSGTVVIPRGAREVAVTVPTYNDRKVETTQTFTIVISNPTGGAALGASRQSGTIGMSD